MKISYNGLKEFIKTDLSIEEIATLLTNLGLEVEGTETYESVKNKLDGVVVGEVLSCEQHPNADRLKITTVKLASEIDPVQIVCGAPNVTKGQKVAVAKVGTTLYGNSNEPFKISKSKIRGEISMGMICAEDELGIGDSHDGILVLDADLEIGTPCQEVFDIVTDTVFEIGLTPNRADAMSHFGVARDLKAACIINKIPFEWMTPEVSVFHVDNTQNQINVEVEATKKAPLYYGLTISDIEIGPSPKWIQHRLKALGMNPKNVVVDITNYVMFELGQPLHSFDADKIKEKIIVKTLDEGTTFTTLDDQERKLSDEDLMICDSENPLCIAGVFGGKESGIDNNTKNIFLESAYFDPVSIRKTAKRHALNTDASFRFERGVDPEIGLYALKRAALLIKKYAGGLISSDIQNDAKNVPTSHSIFLNYATLYQTLGFEFPKETLTSILNALEIEINNVSKEGLALSVPPYRVDVTRPADVIEEILRLYGYNQVPDAPLRFNTQAKYNWKNSQKLENEISNILCGMGFFEILTNSLSSPDYREENLAAVQLLNPLGRELSMMRQSLIFNAIEVAAFNLKRQQEQIKLFEFGTCYHQSKESYIESKRLSLTLAGSPFSEHWNVNQAPDSFFYLKNAVEQVFKALGLVNFSTKKQSHKNYENCLAYEIDGLALGYLGKVAGTITKKFDIDQDLFFAELAWDVMTEKAFHTPLTYKEIPKFPIAVRDLALVLNPPVSFKQIEALALQTERKILEEVSLFDVYEGKGLPEGKKSYGIRFHFRDSQKTLTDKQIDKSLQRIFNIFEKELQAQLR